MKNWYYAITNKGTAHEQGLIIEEETGNAIAVSYKPENAKLIALAPEMLQAILTVYARTQNTNINTPLKDMQDTWDILGDVISELE